MVQQPTLLPLLDLSPTFGGKTVTPPSSWRTVSPNGCQYPSRKSLLSPDITGWKGTTPRQLGMKLLRSPARSSETTTLSLTVTTMENLTASSSCILVPQPRLAVLILKLVVILLLVFGLTLLLGHGTTMVSWRATDSMLLVAFGTQNRQGGIANTVWSISRLAVIAHECGHFLGLPDLYGSPPIGSGVGTFELMGTKLHCDNPCNGKCRGLVY